MFKKIQLNKITYYPIKIGFNNILVFGQQLRPCVQLVMVNIRYLVIWEEVFVAFQLYQEFFLFNIQLSKFPKILSLIIDNKIRLICYKDLELEMN